MSKDEAKQALIAGHKVKHIYFSNDEFIESRRVAGNEEYVDEKGNVLNASTFWQYRQSPIFNEGWSIVQ